MESPKHEQLVNILQAHSRLPDLPDLPDRGMLSTSWMSLDGGMLFR